MKTVDFYFDYRSPYAYLAQSQIFDLDVQWLPMDVLDVMKQVGNVPTTAICGVKRRYAGEDLLRWSRRYNVPFNRHPHADQIDHRRLLRATLAIPPGPGRRTGVHALFHARWATQAPLATVSDVSAVLAQAGVQEPGIAERMDAPELDSMLDHASAAAAERGIFGAPSFVLGEEMFFGNDRIEFLREALARTD